MLLNKQSRESCTYVNTRAELPTDPAIRDSLVNPVKKKKKRLKGRIVKGTNRKRRKVIVKEGGCCIEGRRTVNLPPGHGSILKGLSL